MASLSFSYILKNDKFQNPNVKGMTNEKMPKRFEL
jgi:hypothetical protein